MTLSRTARIMIGILLLAAAAFFWVNFFSREQSQPVPAATATAPKAPAATQPAPAGTSGGATSTAPSATGGQATNGQATATGQTSTSGQPAGGPQAATGGAGSEGGNAPIVATRPAVATHDLQVAELPFLVTQPPEPGTTSGSQQTAGAASSGGPAQTAASAQRMSVNPFSPILVQAPPAPAAKAPAPPPSQKVTSQPAPQQAQQPQTLAQAPAPQPVAPPPPPTGNLASALPSGMLPSTPGVLKTPRVVATPSAPKNLAPTDLGSVAAVREPGSESAGPLGNVTASSGVAAGPSVPELLGPGQPTRPQQPPEPPKLQQPSQPAQPPQPPTATSAAASGTGTPPMQAGTNTLSRYLRDHNVRFTGTVLGPVSVGVFRSDQYSSPVVVSLGQELPQTKITLTDLRGHTAVFSYEDTTQSLSLDLRR